MIKPWRVLLIDDDPLVREAFEIIMPDNWKALTYASGSEIPYLPFHAAFIDMHLSGKGPDGSGLGIIKNLSKKFPHLEIVAISGDLNRTLMENCLKAGASRFLSKPFTPEEVRLILEKIEAFHLLQEATLRQKKNPWVIGKSNQGETLKKQISQLRGESGPILIEGESGTGKEISVQMIHDQEPESRVLISFNVSAVPESLFESELFGHIKGSFTGADQNKMGLAEAAHGGDLFLDEIEALTLPCQVKLLRFLETNEIRRVGDRKSIKIQTRILAATNRNLEKMVEQGTFREDLLWRLNGKKIVLPPLRNRIDDIPDFAQHFLNLQKPRYNKRFSDDAIETLKSHSWPGNIRELKRIVEQVCLTSPLPIIRKEDVEPLLSHINPKKERSYDFKLGLDLLSKNFEKDVIQKCFEQYKIIDDVSDILRVSKSGLYKKIKDYDIKIP